MKKLLFKLLTIAFTVATLNLCRAQSEIQIEQSVNVLGGTKPIPLAIDGFTGEAPASVARWVAGIPAPR